MNSSDRKDSDAFSLIGHELRSPAAIVSGYLRRLLQEDVDRLTDEQRGMIEGATAACGRILRLIQELDDLAALDGDQSRPRAPQPVSVFALCGEVVDAAARESGRPVPAFACADAARPAIVRGDARLLGRAFAALMNATARENGDAELECAGFIGTDHGARHAVILFGRKGLAADAETLVAKRGGFDRWRGGMGLAVPIACRIIEAHGGSVWSNASGDWRAATLWSLPLADARPSPA